MKKKFIMALLTTALLTCSLSVSHAMTTMTINTHGTFNIAGGNVNSGWRGTPLNVHDTGARVTSGETGRWIGATIDVPGIGRQDVTATNSTWRTASVRAAENARHDHRVASAIAFSAGLVSDYLEY